ncbi:MAG: LacI family transcriptional regulator [Spirochaetes bacterium]|nr:MAG: LacI family transcriptional regulator [Spirochaetota bacterium]
MNPTIKDVARLANVSYSTVSRALANRPGVNEATRCKIIRAAEELNYRPNAIARGLVRGQTLSMGLIIPDITNPFFPEVHRGIEDGARESGYSVFLCNTNWERERETHYINLLIEKRVDGIIIAPISDTVDKIEEELKSNIPVVYVSNLPPKTDRSCVAIDNIRGGFLATKHLIESGYREIGFIGAPEGSFSIDQRLEGYKLAFRKYGMKLDQRFICFGDFKRETGYRIIKRMIEEGIYPRAIFAENDLMALGVLQGVKESGLSVPGDIAVVGFDDIPFASFPEVQLTTIRQPKYEMGKMAVQLLLNDIRASNNGLRKELSCRKIILEPELIVRKTG